MADWEEIKRLAADFQRVQLSGTSSKLSERSCIEIVQKLIELKVIDVVYTTDGKEYLTPHEIWKEIREELTVHGGRVNLVDLQQALNVDLSHIESKVNELVKSERNLTLILGQLIDRGYLDNLAEEINDRLQQHGLVTVAELAKAYDLPGDFINQTINARLGHIIKAQTDDVNRDVLYTTQFVTQHRAQIRGIFSAITRPTALGSVISQFILQERLCVTILEDLIGCGRLVGCLSGGRQDKAIYIPDIYTRSQNEWIDSFYKQNGYLEYDALIRLGVSDPKNFIKKRFHSEKLEYLESCCVGKLIRYQVESELEETLSCAGWLDITPLLPSVCSANDARLLLQQLVKDKPSAVTICESFVTSEMFIANCSESFKEAIKVKAETDVRENPSLLLSTTAEGDRKTIGRATKSEEVAKEDKKETRRKKPQGGGSSGKSGGGMQGREVKTKAVKKKNVAHSRSDTRDESDSDQSDEVPTKSKLTDPEFMTVSEITEELRQRATFRDVPEEFVKAIAAQLYRPLTRKYMEEVKTVFSQAMQSTSSSTKRQAHKDLSEKVNGLWTNARLFEKGIALFNDELQQQLTKHLLQTVCTDLTNIIFYFYAADNMVNTGENQITAEIRMKIQSQLTDVKVKQILSRLQSSLSFKTLEEFFITLDAICGPGYLEISLRKPDKKKERQLIFNHRQSLAEQLRAENDPAMALHLAVTLLVQVQMQCMVLAPGRCVPPIIAFLRDRVPADEHSILVQCQDLVIKQLKSVESALSQHTAEGDTSSEISVALNSLLPKVKDVALHSKRVSAAPDDA